MCPLLRVCVCGERRERSVCVRECVVCCVGERERVVCVCVERERVCGVCPLLRVCVSTASRCVCERAERV